MKFNYFLLSYEDVPIRVVTSDRGKTWYCLSDICAYLHFNRPYLFHIPKVEDVAGLPKKENSNVFIKYVTSRGVKAIIAHLRDNDPNNAFVDMFEQEFFCECAQFEPHLTSEVSNPWAKPMIEDYQNRFGDLLSKAEKIVLGTLLVHPEFFDFNTLHTIYGNKIFHVQGYQAIYNEIMQMYVLCKTVNVDLYKGFLHSSRAIHGDDKVAEHNINQIIDFATESKAEFYRCYGLLIVNEAFISFAGNFSDFCYLLSTGTGVWGMLRYIDKGRDVIAATGAYIMPFVRQAESVLNKTELGSAFLGWPDLFTGKVKMMEPVPASQV